MPNPTLREIVETFTEEELALTVPIEFQDVSLEDYPYVNEYNRLLASAQASSDTDEGYNAFQAAYEYRLANQDKIDKYIIDAKKLNILMTLVINAYMFAKGEKSATNTSYDATESQLKDENGELVTNVQDAIDKLVTNVQDAIDELDTSVNSTIQTELDEINETLDSTVEKIELDVKESLSTIDQTLAIRFNETSEVIQIYKDGIWQDWLTAGHDGIIVVSEPKIILDKTDTSIGQDVSGGWSPKPLFSVNASMSGSNYTNTVADTAETIKTISLNSIKHIDLYYSFTFSGSESYKTTTSNAYVELYLINEIGEKISSTKVTNKEKGFGSFSLVLSTSDIMGMHKIGYKLSSYCKEYTDSGYDPESDSTVTWGVTQNIKANVSKMIVYTM